MERNLCGCSVGNCTEEIVQKYKGKILKAEHWLCSCFSFLISGTATFCYRVGVLTPYLLMYLVCRSIFLEFILTITAVVVGFISSQGFYWQNNSSFTVSKGKACCEIYCNFLSMPILSCMWKRQTQAASLSIFNNKALRFVFSLLQKNKMSRNTDYSLVHHYYVAGFCVYSDLIDWNKTRGELTISIITRQKSFYVRKANNYSSEL